jgi:hypothetical protein
MWRCSAQSFLGPCQCQPEDKILEFHACTTSSSIQTTPDQPTSCVDDVLLPIGRQVNRRPKRVKCGTNLAARFMQLPFSCIAPSHRGCSSDARSMQLCF